MISEQYTVNEPRGPKGEPGFDSQTCRHMWVEFVDGSRPCSERFFSGYFGFRSPQKSTFLNSNSIWIVSPVSALR